MSSKHIKYLVRRAPELIEPPYSDDAWYDGIITAASRGSTDTVKKILDFNASREPEFIQKLVINSLKTAVFNGWYSTAEHLLETRSTPTAEEMTLLVKIAAKFGMLKMMKLLYRHGAVGDVDAVWSSVRKGYVSVLKFLTDNGKGVDISTIRDKLLKSAMSGLKSRPDIVKYLLDLPLDYEKRTIESALRYGASNGEPDIVRLAFSRGAVDKSTIRAQQLTLYLRKSCEVVKLYLDYGMYTTYVRWCVNHKAINIVKLIADYGEDLTDFPEEHEALDTWTKYRQSNTLTPEIIDSLKKLYWEMKNYIPINPRRVRGISITPP